MLGKQSINRRMRSHTQAGGQKTRTSGHLATSCWLPVTSCLLPSAVIDKIWHESTYVQVRDPDRGD